MIKTVLHSLIGLVDRSGRHPFIVLLAASLLAAISLFGTSRYLSIDTDSDHLFSNSLPWRQQSQQFAHQFPQNSDVLLAVVRAPTAEEARSTALALSSALAADHTHFRSVSTPGINPFFDQDGLLLLPSEQLTGVLDSILKAQPLLGPLAADPSARGLFLGFDMMVEGVRRGMAHDLSGYDAALDNVAVTLNDALAEHASPLSWQALLTPGLVSPGAAEQQVLIHPVLDHSALEPGAQATQAMLRAASALPDVKTGRAHVDYTGSVPLADEEFHSLTDRALPIAIGSSLLLIFWLVLALRSWRLIVPVIVTLIVGLIFTLGFAAFVIGRLNLVSVAFAVLFVGLAVDFGIQFSVRMHSRLHSERDFAESLHETAVRVCGQIALAAVATSCGFLAFAPTSFTGVAELGIIAGVGMLLALLCTMTVLPALLSLLVRGIQHADVALPGGLIADAWLERHRKVIFYVFAVLAVAGMWCAIKMPFDANPLHTKNADTEAMRTLASLSNDPNTNPFSMDLIVKDLPTAQKVSTRLSALPEVAQVVSGADFIPPDQDNKLDQIEQASDLMVSVLTPPSVAAPPTVAELRAAALDSSNAIASVSSKLPANSPLRRIGMELDRLAKAPDATLTLANQALSRFLPDTLKQLNDSLSAQTITLKNLPEAFKRDWFTPDNQVHIMVTPTAQAQNTAGLRRFVQAVHSVAPDAVGAASDTVNSADTILNAFKQAALYATLAIALVLVLVLRRIRDAALVLMTLLMSALLTALMARLLGISINFANIIALPLLLGVGVSFNVYFVMNWRLGMRQFIGSPTARAILFSALTTGTAFGSLAIARHPGTASMGLLLLLSLLGVVISTFMFLPAVLYSILQSDAASAKAR